MQAGKRKIKPGYEYDHLFPKCRMVDTVVQPEGKAKLHHTINLIKEMVATTLEDTAKIAPVLKGSNLRDTCRRVWKFVYDHIQYKLDEKGIEQVRRPSRVWAERKTGCDCDCMTVMVSSILTNLGIDHKIRITKYPVRNNPWLVPRYQHIYSVVTGDDIPIVMDTVTNWFDYEVPFLEKKDFNMNDGVLVGTIEGIMNGFSGVDSLALREVIAKKSRTATPKIKHSPVYGRTVNPGVNINILFNQGSSERQEEKAKSVLNPLPQTMSPAGPMTTGRSMYTERQIQPLAVKKELEIVQARPITTIKQGGIFKKALIAGVVAFGSYHLIKALT